MCHHTLLDIIKSYISYHILVCNRVLSLSPICPLKSTPDTWCGQLQLSRQICTAPQASSGSSSRCALRPLGLHVVLPAVCPLLLPMLCRKEAVGIMTLDTVLRRDAYTSSQQTMGSNRRPTGLAGSRYFPPWHGRWAERKQQSC